MLNKIKNFVNNESGAVTIDWVILTAGVVVMAIAIYNIVEGMGTKLGSDMNDAVNAWGTSILSTIK